MIHFDRKHYRIPDEVVPIARKAYGATIPIIFDLSDISGTICVLCNNKKYPLSLDDPSANNNARRNTGGRKSQLESQEWEREKKKQSVAEQRAEERYRKRMNGVNMLSGAKGVPVPESSAGIKGEETNPVKTAGSSLSIDYEKV